MNSTDIKEDTITIAVDLQGGMCDRLMLGTQGIINNAVASLDSWKFLAPDDEDVQSMENPKDIENALAILFTDNFHVEVVKDLKQIQELLKDNEVSIDLNHVEFTDNIYRIY